MQSIFEVQYLDGFSLNLTVVMFSLRNLLFRLFQYYGIIFGFSYYYYVDIEKHVVKCYIFARIYAFLINLFLCGAFTINIVIGFKQSFLSVHSVMVFIITIQHISQALMMTFNIILILKGGKFLKKLDEIFLTQLPYFEMLKNISIDKKTEKIVFLKIFVILTWNIYITQQCIQYILQGDWENFHTTYLQHLLSCLPHYIMWHHVFILCHIDRHCLKLNAQLECNQVQENFADIYKQLSLLLQQTNAIYGPIVISAIAYVLVSHSIHVCVTLQYTVR